MTPTPTPTQQAIDDLLKIVYNKESIGEVTSNMMIDYIDQKYNLKGRFSKLIEEDKELFEFGYNFPLIKITNKGWQVQQQGGYIAMLQEQERIQQREEYLKELEISDKLGSIEDRKKNRRLAWIAIGISVASAIWTVISNVFLDK